MTSKSQATDAAILNNDDQGKEATTAVTTPTEPAAETITKAPLKNYWRILSFGSRYDHVLLLLGLCGAAGSGTALPLMNIVFGNLVGGFNSYFIPGTTTTKSEFLHSVNQNALLFVYLFIGRFLLSYVSAFCFRVGGLRVSAALRMSYMQSLFRQHIRKLDQTSAGVVSNTITASANNIQLSISEKLSVLFQSLALIIAAYAIAFRYSWQLTLVTTSPILFICLIYTLSTPVVIKLHQSMDKADEKHATVAGEIFSSIRTVMSLGAGKPLSDRYLYWVDESRKRGLNLAPYIGIQVAPMFFGLYCSFSLAFWYALKLFRQGHLGNVNSVVIVIFSVIIVSAVLAGVVIPIMLITKAISASTSFFDMIDSPRIDRNGRREPDVSAREEIELDNITFAYPTRSNVAVLKNFSARFAKGKTTAIVGPSGSGKSTIVALLERWYELSNQAEAVANENAAEKAPGVATESKINDGVIRVGGQDITTFDLKWWRTQIGLVSQEPFLFNDTILNNVAFGLLGTEWEHVSSSEKQQLVTEACQEAFADEFIDRLPQRYMTMVGESGIKLSGGQRQRIAIARSIVRKPSILLLDEATSSIDIRSEKIVQAALDRASAARTTIVIAHRLSTIRKADHIIVLRDGTKVEEGTHEYLISIEDGLYSGLVQAQQIGNNTNEAISGRAEDNELERTLPKQETKSSFQLAEDEESQTGAKYANRGIISSIGVFLLEQRQHWLLYALTILGAIGGGTSFPLQAWFFSKMIEAFRFTGQELVNAGNHWSLQFFILALGLAAAYFTIGYSSVAISHHVACACRKDYFGNILRRPIPFFDAEGNASGSLMSRLSSDPRLLFEILGMNGAFTLIAIFNLTGCIIIAFCFGWKLSLVAVCALMPVLIGCSFIRLRHEHSFEKMNSEVFAQSSQFATEAIGAFRTVSSLTMEDTILTKYSTLLDDQIKRSTRKASYAMLVYAFTESVELAAVALIFWYGGQLLGSREYDPLSYFVIYVAAVQGSQGTGTFMGLMPNLHNATAGANRILSMRETESDKQDASKLQPLPPSDTNLGAAVEFKQVSFRYPKRSIPTFLNLSFSIPAGSYVAFVGPSGVGKSTIISLLERFYTPLLGTITYDGTDVSTIDVTSYRSDISLVAQEPKLFEGSVKENLLLGVHGKNVSDEDMHQACKDAEIHDFIASLPEGYDTPLGLNSSTALSGGQKQRLCLARALLRKPKLLLLDEATSSLDSQSEKLVQAAIERLAAGRNMTVVAVAHRLATIQKADCIFVFSEGESERGARLAEKGSHMELIGRRGVYWQMCRGQALDR